VNALTVDLQGGLLSGSGTVTGNVLNGAAIDVGGMDSTGTLTITRNYEQTATGVLNIELGGTARDEFDQLVTNSSSGNQAALFAGTLNIGLIDGTTLTANDTLNVVVYDGEVSGDFSQTNGLDIGGGLVLQKEFTGTALTLTAVPALHLDGRLDSPTFATPITQDLVQPVLATAIEHLLAAGLPATAAAVLQQTEIVMVDLPGTALATAVGNRILLDVTAAGAGWFVDLTPDDDLEFDIRNGTLTATQGPASRYVDLLTVLAHELAHLLGAEHDVHGLEEILRWGQRRVPHGLAVDAYFETLGLGHS
jgi:hypothetical protein